MKKKERLDVLLVEKGLYSSREKAQAAVMTGMVAVDQVIVLKPGQRYSADASIEIKEQSSQYVSRGGQKLDKALSCFQIDVIYKICLDVGASTGGFTDCLLQNGAKKVYAVDVGYGQLAWKLRNDTRVVVKERTNIRSLKSDSLKDRIDLAVIDVSFISLTKVLIPVLALLSKQGEIVCLVKPQFEVGKSNVGKKGVVKDPAMHVKCLNDLSRFFKDVAMHFNNLTYSPITGPEGNIEFLVHLIPHNQPPSNESISSDKIEQIVQAAHQNLKNS